MSSVKALSKVCLVWLAGFAGMVTPSALCQSIPVSDWLRAQSAVSDLDGDHQLDVAADESTPRADGGYLHHIRLRLSHSGLSSFTIDTDAAARRLTALDVDGDSDRDLVLENDRKEPIAIWLNDGSGNFHQGSLATYFFRLTHADPRSVAALPSSAPSDSSAGLQGGAALLSAIQALPELVRAGVALTSDSPLRPAEASSHDSRGPPASL